MEHRNLAQYSAGMTDGLVRQAVETGEAALSSCETRSAGLGSQDQHVGAEMALRRPGDAELASIAVQA